MIDHIFKFPAPFIKSTKNATISLIFVNKRDFPEWIKKQNKPLKTQATQAGFEAEPKQVTAILNDKGEPETILVGLSDPVYYLDSASTVEFIQNHYSNDFIKKYCFKIVSTHQEDISNKIAIGWGLAVYKFEAHKSNEKASPILVWPSKADQREVTATIESVSLLKNLVNTPPNVLGTDELASAAKRIAKDHKAKIKIIHDDELLKKNFPLIYTVGKASPRRPQLIDITWGKSSHPKVTIVGKGIVYDTGGLNLKPGQYMRDMKKDMGGAAHALGVAWMIMTLELPVQLRVLLPVAENSVSGNSYRPGDILNSRKGITIEINDTDAEGRLVVADALTYACEEKPDLLVDFCTLTGAARVAVGYDIPAFFSNRDEYLDNLRHSSVECDDPCWPFPLWDGYDHGLNGDISDIRNEGTGRAGHIEAALFLQRFIEPSVDWIHLDCFAWEQNGKAGRPKGGADTGMRSILNFIRDKYT